MTQDKIIELARQAGMNYRNFEDEFYSGNTDGVSIEHLEVFAKLAVETEREACANICDLAMLRNKEAINELENYEHIAKCFIEGAMNQSVKTAKAIRARGKA